MRGGWNAVAEDVLLDPRSRQRGLVNTPALAALLRDHREGRRNGGDAIWALLNLELWYRTFIDGLGTQTLPAPYPHPRQTAPGCPASAFAPGATADKEAGHHVVSAAAPIALQRTQG
jgi:hypothetical protein